MVFFVSFFLFILNLSKDISILSLLLRLELFILIMLNLVRLINFIRPLGLFGLSFFFIRIVVLAATIGLVILRGLKKVNKFTMKR